MVYHSQEMYVYIYIIDFCRQPNIYIFIYINRQPNIYIFGYIYIYRYVFGCLQNSVQIELLQIEAYSANPTY